MIIRASSLGACVKSQIADHLGYTPMPHSEHILGVMKEGQLHEDDVVATLTAEGHTITRQQEEVNLGLSSSTVEQATFNREVAGSNPAGGTLVQGHIDGVVRLPDVLGDKVLEVKSMSHDVWKEFQAKGWEASGLVQKYQWQLSAYMLATGLEGYLVAKNRNTGQLLRFGVETPFHSLEEITERVAYIHDHVTSGVLPEGCPHDFFCQHKYLCERKAEESPPEVLHDPVLEGLLADYTTAQAQETTAKNRKKELREVLDGRIRQLNKASIGEFDVAWVTRTMPERVTPASEQAYPSIKRREEGL